MSRRDSDIPEECNAGNHEGKVIYGVSPIMQDALVTKHCFGDCGKIQCAGADGGPVLGSIEGRKFKLRKLK